MFDTPATDPSPEPRAGQAITLETLRALLSVSEEMTPQQVRALVLLSTAGAQTVASLADALSAPESTTNRACTRLVNRGLVIRVPSAANPHEFVVALSTAGRRIIDDATFRQADERARPQAEALRDIPKMSVRIAEDER